MRAVLPPARSVGADHVIDPAEEDFTRGDRRDDVLDVVGKRVVTV